LGASVDCSAGKKPLGGGFSIRLVNRTADGPNTMFTRPTPTGWEAEVDGTNNTMNMRAWVVCA
jgi:hypothetical protein